MRALVQSHFSLVFLLSDLTCGFWLMVKFEGIVSWYEVFSDREIKGTSDHFMQIKLVYCKRNLTLLWQYERNRVGIVVFNDTERFSLIAMGIDIAKNITTVASYQVKSPFNCLCHILSSVMSNSSYHDKNIGLWQNMQ